jgi:hypothetical protein
MEIEYPVNYDSESLKQTFLWRYLDIHKLIDLLHNEQIYFTRLDMFEDALEGITARDVHFKAFTQGAPLTEDNINKALPREAQLDAIERDKKMRMDYEENLSNSQQTQFASCWFLGNRESVAMWKLYSSNGGVAVKFNASDLIETVIAAASAYTHSDFEVFLFGNVEYKNIWPFDPREKFDGVFNALKKDHSYSHEKEFRFIAIVSKNAKGRYQHFTLPLGSLKTYNFEIITNPFMSDNQKSNLKNLLSKYSLEEKIRYSQIAIKRNK